MDVRHPDVEPAFAAYVEHALAPALDHFGVVRQPGEKESISFVRGRLLATLADEGRSMRARSYGDSLAAAYLVDAASVDPALAPSALQIAALDGDAALWDSFRSRFEAAQNPGERRNFLQALAGFRAPDLQQKTLDYALAGPLRAQEVLAASRGVGEGSEAGRDASFKWMRENYDQIMKRVPPMLGVFLPHAASGCSAERLTTAQAFFSDPAHAPPGTEKELAKVTESTEDCMKLRQREGGRVSEFLQRAAVAN